VYDRRTEARRVRLAVRGDDGVVAAAVRAAAGAELVTHDPDAVLLAGEDALCSLAADVPDAPALPVDAGHGHHSVSRSSLPGALATLVRGDTRTVSHPILAAVVDGTEVARAVLDVALVTDEPARISEYGVHALEEEVDSFRADGVVAATPAGSNGYARACGGPILAPGTGLAVVPVAPFSTLSDAWVLRSPVTLSVERDDSPVVLVADDRDVCEVTVERPVRITETTTVDLLQVAVPPAHRERG
jgi:NAD+ kinase